jgi:hypothetical protein
MSSKVFIGESLLAYLWKNNQDQIPYRILDYYTNLYSTNDRLANHDLVSRVDQAKADPPLFDSQRWIRREKTHALIYLPDYQTGIPILQSLGMFVFFIHTIFMIGQAVPAKSTSTT